MSTSAEPASLSADAAPLLREDVAGSRCLLVAFGGVAGQLAMPPFEFFRIAGELPVSKLFLRDLAQQWYQGGLPGLADDVPSLAALITAEARQRSGERLVLFGNSMGGYAALLMGVLAGAHEVHAFAPQTFLGRWRRSLHRDRRWPEPMRRAQRVARARGGRRFLDLRPLIAAGGHQGALHVHYSPLDALDALHAERLAGLPGLTLHRHEQGGHDTIRSLRDSGELAAILRHSLRDL